MFSRRSIRWFVPLAALAACALGIAFANGRLPSFPETRGVASGDAGIPFAKSKKHNGPRPATAYPKTDPSKPGATTWIKYRADDVLPYGIGIGVCDDVIVGVVSEDLKHPAYELMCTRYVVGDLDKTDITMPLWRRLDLKMPKPDGSISELSVLRPLWWIEETGAKTGGTIDLGMHEIGISGEATVIKIGPCEVDSRDNENGSQVVTGTIKHHNAEVWDLVFNNDVKKPLGVTANHPIYSFDRDDWVPAGELKINEKVRTMDGTATLTSKSKRPTRETVYNLEVHRSHAYHVSQFGILAHNAGILSCDRVRSVVSSIGDNKNLIRHAEDAGRRVQASINHLENELVRGNLNPGVGTKHLFGNIYEARARDGARVYFEAIRHKVVRDGKELTEMTINIVGKSDKQNQAQVIAILQNLFGS
jgi:hypothetical protein